MFDIVNAGKLKNVFVSIFGDVNSPQNQVIINKINEWARVHPRTNYYIFDAESATVWNHPDAADEYAQQVARDFEGD